MVFLIEKYDDNDKIQNMQSEKNDHFEQNIENYLIIHDPLNFTNDTKKYLYYNGISKQEEESIDNIDEDNNINSGRLSAKILIKNDSDEESDYFAYYFKQQHQQQQQQQNQLQLIPFKRRNSVSFTSISTSSMSSTSSSSSFSIPPEYGIKINVNETEMTDDDRSITTIDTSSPNYNMKINFITKEKLDCIQNELINQIMADIDLKHQLLNNKITSFVSNCGDLKLNELFLIYLLQKLNLTDLLLINESSDNGGFYLNETLYLIKRNDFLKNLNRLLMCLNKMELEFYDNFSTSEPSMSALLTSDHLFDANFFLNLSFLVYEQADSLTSRNLFNQKLSSDDNLFEMDEQDSLNNEKLYEENLNILIINFIIKNLPDLIKLPCFSGKLILQFFANLFDNDFNLNISQNDCNQQKLNDYIDINNYMSKPFLSNEKVDFIIENPITQSFQTFLNNLNALNYQTHDPFIEAKQNDIMTMDYSNFYANKVRSDFNQNNNMSARLAFSYYTMGYFEVEKNLFDNTYQSIYDSREFNNEFEELFQSYNDLPPQLSKLNVNKSSKSIWSNVPNQILSSHSSTEINNDYNENDLIDDIINRISTLNTSSLFDSYFKILSDSYLKETSAMKSMKTTKENNCSCCSVNNISTTSTSKETTNTRNWTVAPKLLPTNTISNCKSRTIQSLPILSNSSSFEDSSIIYKSQNDLINNWNRKVDLRPIGTKPVSMYTTPNSTNRFGMNKYQKYINNPLLSSNINVKKNYTNLVMFNEQVKDDKNIWSSSYNNCNNDLDASIQFISTSPFTSYHYTNKSSVLDEFTISCENIKQNNNKMQFKNFNNMNSKQINTNATSYSNTNSTTNNGGRYSVAPMNYSKKISDHMNDYRTSSFNNNNNNNNNNKQVDMNHHARSSSSSHWSSTVNARSSPINHSNFTVYNRQPRLSEPNIQFLKEENIIPNTTSSKPSKTVYSISKDSYGNNQSYKYNNSKKVYDYEMSKYSSSYDEKNDRHFNQISTGSNDYGNDRYGKSNMNNNIGKKYNGNNYRSKGNQRI